MTHDNYYFISPMFGPYHMYCGVSNYKDYSTEELKNFAKGGKYAEGMPTNFVVCGGRTKHDIMYSGSELILISEKLKLELESINATGAEFVPVTITNKKGKIYSDYYAMLVLGRAKQGDRNDSNTIFFAEKEHLRAMWHDVGDFFPLDSWDGNDIFLCEEEGKYFSVCVTERIRSVLDKYSNSVWIKRCSEFIWPGGSEKLEKGADPFDPNAKLRNV